MDTTVNDIAVLLASLRALKVTLLVRDGKLVSQGAQGALTPEWQSLIRQNKAAILDYLNQASAQAQLVESIPPLLPVSRDQLLPLSFAQQRMWILDQMDPGSAAYHIAIQLRLHGTIDVAALRLCFDHLLQRHESLRTTFIDQDGVPHQVIASEPVFSFPLTDLSQISEEERETHTRELVLQDAQAAFDLQKGPLLRASLIRLAGQEHILLCTAHHIITDGWSMGVLMNEMAMLYAAFVSGQPSPLPQLDLQYADFAHWQRQWLSGAVLAQQLDFWRRNLDGAPPLLSMPFDRPRPLVQSTRGASHRFQLSAELTSRLHGICRQSGSTLFMALLAAFNVLLARYSGQTDILVGSPIANRNRAETEGVVGFFVNTLVFRTRMDDDPPFSTLLERVRANALDAYAYQDVPFEQLVEMLKPPRHTGHTPLFQVMLVLQNTPTIEMALPGLRLQQEQFGTAAAKFDLTLELHETGGQIAACFDYNTDLFDPATVARLARHFCNLLQGIVTDPASRIQALPLMDVAEQEQIRLEWNPEPITVPDGETVQQLFEMHASRVPDAIAVICGQAQISYASLNARANVLAHRLRQFGVGPDVLTGICSLRSIDMVTAILAVLKAGGAYVPLDPAYPAQRLAFMLADAAPQVLLVQAGISPNLATMPALSCRVLCLDTLIAEPDGMPQSDPPALVSPDNLAYMIYTSGSSGQPKGVQITHGGLLASTRARIHYYAPFVRHLLISSISFDSSVAAIFGSLASGQTLVLPDEEQARDPLALSELIRQANVHTVLCVPSLYAEILNDLQSAGGGALQQVIVAGEACQPDLVLRSRQRLPQVALFNEYGPTETSVWASVCRTTDLRHLAGRSTVPIGSPAAHSRIYLLDSALQPVPVGVTGEIHIAGAGLARGYRNRPDLSAEKFIPDPWGLPGARMYKSGDLARYLADGSIEFLGRIDEQVKIRGFRIEPGEIQAALANLPAVQEALVLVREDGNREKRLIAYWIPAAASDVVSAQQLRLALMKSLPEYMIPAHFISLACMPLTPNGKVDRAALPGFEGLVSEVAHVAPRTPLEQKLAEIWQDVLQRERIGVDDDFFALGGHSLLAIQIVVRVRQQLGYRTAVSALVSALFTAPTVATFAQLLETAGPVSPSHWIVPLALKQAAPVLFLIHGLGGETSHFSTLAQALQEQFSVHGVGAPELSGLPSAESLDELAAIYAAEMLRLHTPPFALAGWSMGGLLALKVAQLIEDQGHAIMLVALLDTFSAPSAIDAAELQAQARAAMVNGLSASGLVGQATHPALFAHLATHGIDDVMDNLHSLQIRAMVEPDLLDHIEARLPLMMQQLRTGQSYSPVTLRAPVSAFLAQDRPEADEPGVTALARSAGGWRLHRVPGDHFSILTTGAASIADCLSRREGR